MPNRFSLAIVKGTFRAIRYFDARNETFDISTVKKILIINTTAIGDTLFAAPAIRAIRKGFPNAWLSVLASKAAQSVLLFNPHIDEIIDYPGRVNIRYLFHLPRLIRTLRKGKFDLAVILHANDPDAAPLAYVSGAPHRMGWKESKLAFLHTIPVETRVSGMHGIDIHLKNLKHIGIKDNERKMEFYLSKDERKWAEMYIGKIGLEGKSLIGIHPFGSKRNKWWPAQNVVEFCRKASQEWGFSPIIFGGKNESQIAEVICQKAYGTINVAGVLSIRESAAMIERCTVFISTDSGPMHIAQALGVPLIALFGPDDPKVTGPVTPPYVIIQKTIPCAPCRLKTCNMNYECMQEITPDDVRDALEDLLQQRI